MECRQMLVKAVENGTSVAQAAKEAGVSRQVAHKWLKRHREGGEEALNDLSRAPPTVPGKTPEELIERCLQLRRQNPTWGPTKVRAWLAASEPGIEAIRQYGGRMAGSWGSRGASQMAGPLPRFNNAAQPC